MIYSLFTMNVSNETEFRKSKWKNLNLDRNSEPGPSAFHKEATAALGEIGKKTLPKKIIYGMEYRKLMKPGTHKEDLEK